MCISFLFHLSSCMVTGNRFTNNQTICVTVKLTSIVDIACFGMWVRSLNDFLSMVKYVNGSLFYPLPYWLVPLPLIKIGWAHMLYWNILKAGNTFKSSQNQVLLKKFYFLFLLFRCRKSQEICSLLQKSQKILLNLSYAFLLFLFLVSISLHSIICGLVILKWIKFIIIKIISTVRNTQIFRIKRCTKCWLMMKKMIQ